MATEQVQAHQMILLPPAPGVCQECAADHDPAAPHNLESLCYQYLFLQGHGRWPTWDDALAHCAEEIRALWWRELAAYGIAPGVAHGE